ncbi:MAG: rhamnulokinase family protein [Planctomycetota bacterium]
MTDSGNVSQNSAARLIQHCPTHLAIDVGASGGRVIAGGIADGKFQLETLHRFANGPVRVQDRILWDPLRLWQEIVSGLASAGASGESGQRDHGVQSIGVDTWGVDYVLLDEFDQMVGPAYHHRDSRTEGLLERTFQVVSRQSIFEITGAQFIPINTLYQLMASRLDAPSHLQIADCLLMMPDFFHWLLTGKRSVEYTDATTTQLVDAQTMQWSTSLINRLGLPEEIFIPISQPGTTLGPLQPSVSRMTGLEDVPIILPATHDTGSAVLAVPTEHFGTDTVDWCYISSGTWSLMGVELTSPLLTPALAEENFTNEGGVQGTMRVLKNIGGLWVLQQIRASLQRAGHSLSWDSIVQSARSAPAFAMLIDPDAPELLGPPDMIDGIRELATRTNQTFPQDQAALFRSALEGLAMRYRLSLASLERLIGNRINTIHIVGGGSMNTLLCQFTADACNRRVVAGPVEATATGNVLMQMIGKGTLADVASARALVRSSFQVVTYEPDPNAARTYDEPAKRFEAQAS